MTVDAHADEMGDRGDGDMELAGGMDGDSERRTVETMEGMEREPENGMGKREMMMRRMDMGMGNG